MKILPILITTALIVTGAYFLPALFLEEDLGAEKDFSITAEEKFDEEKSKLKEELKIKAEDKKDVLYSSLGDVCIDGDEFDCKKTMKVVNYVYKSETKFPKQIRYIEDGKLVKEKKNKTIESLSEEKLFGADSDTIEEDINKRTYNTMFFPWGDGTTTAEIFSGATFYYEYPDWNIVEYATTTISAYNLQMDSNYATTTAKSWLNYKIIGTALASSLSEYSGAGDGRLKFGYGGYGNGESWSTITQETTTTDVDDTNTVGYAGVFGDNVSNNWLELVRGYFQFDTSAIPDSDTIDSATIYLYIHSIGASASGLEANVVEFNPATNNSLVGDDFDNIVKTALSDSNWDADSISTGYDSFALNSTGLSNISKTSYSNFAFLLDSDITEIAPSWVSGGGQNIMCRTSEYTGTASDPYISITYTAGSGETPAKKRTTIIMF